jgi:hypothetical protein
MSPKEFPRRNDRFFAVTTVFQFSNGLDALLVFVCGCDFFELRFCFISLRDALQFKLPPPLPLRPAPTAMPPALPKSRMQSWSPRRPFMPTVGLLAAIPVSI